MTTELTSLTGIVIPASWDACGAVLGTAIVTFDEDLVTVADTGAGRGLKGHLRKTVSVTGQIQIQGTAKIIHVREFCLEAPGETPGPPDKL